MKKLAVFLLPILLLCFSGCSLSPYREGSEYIVTALGIDGISSDIRLTVEAIPVNSEDAEASPEAILLKGRGKTLPEAFADCSAQAAEPLLLGHVGLIALGQSVDAPLFRETADWFYSKKSATLSTLFAAAQSAEELLEASKPSSIAVGYDAVGMLRSHETESGISLKNRFYEAESLFLRAESVVALPFISVTEDSFFSDGIIIYKEYAPCLRLTGDDVFFYSLASRCQKKGSPVLNGETLNIIQTRVKADFSNAADRKILLSITVKTDRGRPELEYISDGITRLFEKAKPMGLDIFSLTTLAASPFSEAEPELLEGELLKLFSLEVKLYE